MSQPSKDVSLRYLRQTIDLAQQSPPKPTNFRVGCVIVSLFSSEYPQVLSTGFTLELPGNTHAEQCALSKLAAGYSLPEDDISSILSPNTAAVLYTSLEPCGKRLSGNLPCVQRIIATRKGNPDGGIRKVVFGAKEPGTFVQDSQSCKLLTDAGIEWEYLPDFEEAILEIAKAGHQKTETPGSNANEQNIAPDKATEATAGEPLTENLERQRAEAAPRNPKKRMMEEFPAPQGRTS